jgi:hypothetical protein
MIEAQVHKDSVRSFMKWRRLILGVVVGMVSSCGFAQVACSARTPEQALPSGSVAATDQPISNSPASFYRLARIVVDPELHRRWALIANCTHPERPLEIVALSGHVVVPNRATQSVASASLAPGGSLPIVQAEVVPRQTMSSPPRITASKVAVVAKTSTPDPSAMMPVIRAGDLVRLWSSDGNVRLEMAVISLEYGRIGQVIHVRRMGQTTLLAGVVVGEDSAELIP